MAQITSLTSVYNGEQFLAGCLEDLLLQTAYASGDLEIIVIDAGSTDGTPHILRDYLKRGFPIQVIRSLREGMYTSWNRGLLMATGEYVTAANVDDRHAPHALETLSMALDAHPDTALAYADCFVTDLPNARWGSAYPIDTRAPYPTGRLDWPDFDPLRLLNQCYIGPQFMLRKSVAQTVGGFDESYMLAGDYEYALRLVAHRMSFVHIKETLGLFYSGGMGMASAELTYTESIRAIRRWQRKIEQAWQTIPT